MWKSVNLDIQQNDQLNCKVADDGSIEQNYIQIYTAQADTIAYTAIDALTADDGVNIVPQQGGYYIIDGTAYWLCNQVMPRRSQNNPFLWYIQINFQRKIGIQPPGKTNWSAQISFAGEKNTQDCWVDIFNSPVVNSAGDGFDPSVKETIYDEVVNLQYQTVSPPDLRSYRGYCNSSTLNINLAGVSRSYSKRTLMLSDGDISTTLTLGDSNTSPTPIWTVKLVFVNRADGFTETVLDRGFQQLTSAHASPNVCVGGGNHANANEGTIQVVGLQAMRMRSSDGSETATQVNLNGSGQAVTSGDDPTFLCFYVVPQTDLSPLFNGF